MLVTVTNLSATLALNDPDVVDNRLTGGPADLYATGGNVNRPLPYPFDRELRIAGSGTRQRSMHTADLVRQIPWRALPPSSEWNQLVQGRKVTLTIGAETAAQDVEDTFVHAV